MTISIWRYAHLALALLSAGFLIILSITGAILAYDAVDEKANSAPISNFENITLSQSITGLRLAYPEIIEVKINHNQQVSIDALDNDGNSIKGIIHPISGELLSDNLVKSDFINWVTALHRSLFLKETGRILVAVVSFLLFLISISGLILLLKRQQGFKNFFAKVHKDSWSQYFHVVSGRLLLIPIIIISLTATYIYISSLEMFKGKELVKNYTLPKNSPQKSVESFDLFKEISLSEVTKIEFPFIADDPEEFFFIHLKTKELTVNQITGELVSEKLYPISTSLSTLNLDLHTGRTNIIWAIILGIASINILFFIYSGFVITIKRTKNKIKNRIKIQDATTIILVGSENGSTLFFANKIFKSLLKNGQQVYLGELNDYQNFPKAQELIIFTSTYGLGTAPINANFALSKINTITQNQKIKTSIVGFGSTSYPDFCAFAKDLYNLLMKENWCELTLPLHCINNKSTDEFIQWVKAYNKISNANLTEISTNYIEKLSGFKNFKVLEKTEVNREQRTFKIVLKPITKTKIQSGDLMAIYPNKNNIERLYSIGMIDGNIQLMVKLYEQGLGSNFLYNLSKNDSLKARIINNPTFHFPSKTKEIAMIANGTGIAPFLGMINQNKNKLPIKLFVGLRHQDELSMHYQNFAQAQINLHKLQSIDFAFSRELDKMYVMNLVQNNADYFCNLLLNNGSIMICGSLAMQQNVEHILNEILENRSLPNVSYFKNNHQILSDCY